jgi:hypothetical protein
MQVGDRRTLMNDDREHVLDLNVAARLRIVSAALLILGVVLNVVLPILLGQNASGSFATWALRIGNGSVILGLLLGVLWTGVVVVMFLRGRAQGAPARD